MKRLFCFHDYRVVGFTNDNYWERNGGQSFLSVSFFCCHKCGKRKTEGHKGHRLAEGQAKRWVQSGFLDDSVERARTEGPKLHVIHCNEKENTE